MNPAFITTAYTSLPPVHINGAYTPTTNTLRYNRYKKFPSKKPTYDTKFTGCPGHQADAEGQLNL
eukprot:480077-Ditylum_brightwellii.AAC.1